ncbi:hypothetical protein RirG_148970 [Rhizophagus irregularis DAOM 197198w]|uniref:Reverse transcriptase domain-containing protein n=2 Tax=Rhizophagus irregularis TaxID=588596 RepID=A0A015K8H8_RHIIW|nr:hypothetical protein RirG_148970 [Rhizophagus irregularis DAOM 197198w]
MLNTKIMMCMIHEYKTSLVGYLDDTTWFGSSSEQINEKLSIANLFYSFTNIKINVDEYKVLTNISKRNKTVTLNINGLPHEALNQGERILGLYINASNRSQPTLKKGKQIIVIPKLEYIFQHTILNWKQCQQLMVPLKKLFKNRLILLVNTPDNVIYNHIFQNINNFYDIQVKAQLNSLGALFNTLILRQLAIQKIHNVGKEIWYPTIPYNIKKYTKKIRKPTYLTKSLEF